MDESRRRDDASDEPAATEPTERIQQATTGRMMPIDVGAGPGGTIVTEAVEKQDADDTHAPNPTNG